MPRTPDLCVQWTENETVELLAQLDTIIGNPRTSYCNVDDTKIEQEKTTIIHLLYDVFGGKFTNIEIEKKLRSLFDEGEVWSDWNFRLVFRQGSFAFNALGETVACLVEARKKEILVNTPRKSRTSTRHTRSSLDRDVSASVQSPSPLASRKTSGKRSRAESLPRAKAHQTKRKRTSRGRSSSKPNSHPETPIERTPQPDSHKKRRRIIDTITSNINTSYHATSKKEEVPPIMDSAADFTDLQHTPRQDTFTLPSVESNTIVLDLARGKKERVQAEMLTDELRSDVLHFQNKLAEAQERIEHLENQLRLNHSQEKLLERSGCTNIPREIQDQLRQKDNQITRLKARIRTQLFLQPYLAQDDKKPYIRTMDKLRSSYENLRGSLESIASLPSLEHRNTTTSLTESSDLTGILTAVTGSKDYQSFISSWPEMKGLFSVGELTQCSVGAAVREWVFQERLNVTALTSTPLLETYRSLIQAACDEDAFRGLDLAVHQSLIEDDHFKAHFHDVVVPRYSSKLTDRYLAVLSYMLVADSDPKATRKFKKRLRDVFRSALKFKMLLVLQKERYECLWPVYNSSFDAKTMEIEEHKANGALQGHRIRLPLIPGIRMYEQQRGTIEFSQRL